jgi:hypothetical protein
MAGARVYLRGGPFHAEVREVDHPLPLEEAWAGHRYLLAESTMLVGDDRHTVYRHDPACCGGWDQDDDPDCE